MTRFEALQTFFSSFVIPAYEENTVPDTAAMPYITYESVSDSFGSTVQTSADVWYRSTSWADANSKALAISDYVSDGGVMVSYTGGCAWIKRGTPFIQHMTDDVQNVRRVSLNFEIDFI